ncbi:MAG: hypothetical protein A4S16_13000 [Proteobacteria bacterium SG_bin6]|nr:MAG: hypothetical protein A4S16_13000 [Proteobacteria bacterium SG_bin6]
MGRLSSGVVPLLDRSRIMPLATAQSLGLNLSRTLMTVIVLIKTGQGYFVIPADEFDGDPDQVVREYDPFAR